MNTLRQYLRWIYSLSPNMWQCIGLVLLMTFWLLGLPCLLSVPFGLTGFFSGVVLGMIFASVSVGLIAEYQNDKNFFSRPLKDIKNWWRRRPKETI